MLLWLIILFNVTFAAALSNDTELFKCLAENGMKENGYSCVFFFLEDWIKQWQFSVTETVSGLAMKPNTYKIANRNAD